MKPREVAKLLGVDHESLRDVKKAVKRLIRSGKLAYGPDHLVELPSVDTMDRISGIFKRTQGGFERKRSAALHRNRGVGGRIHSCKVEKAPSDLAHQIDESDVPRT